MSARETGSGMREPYALKGACTVPGRGEDGDILSLFDVRATQQIF